MPIPNDLSKLRDKLTVRREELVALLNRYDESRKELADPEQAEPQELGTNEALARRIDSLDHVEARELKAVNDALRRMEDGGYGRCAECGEEISAKRLEAVPWARKCIECATRAEPAAATAPPPPPEGELPLEFRGVSDEEKARLVLDKLAASGGLDLDELQVEVDDGRLRLSGALPSPSQHELLLEIIAETMGFHDYLDEVRIDRTLWQRRDRTSGRMTPERSKAEQALEGEGEEARTMHESLDQGGTVSPPDQLKPENS